MEVKLSEVVALAFAFVVLAIVLKPAIIFAIKLGRRVRFRGDKSGAELEISERQPSRDRESAVSSFELPKGATELDDPPVQLPDRSPQEPDEHPEHVPR